MVWIIGSLYGAGLSFAPDLPPSETGDLPIWPGRARCSFLSIPRICNLTSAQTF